MSKEYTGRHRVPDSPFNCLDWQGNLYGLGLVLRRFPELEPYCSNGLPMYGEVMV